MKSDTDARARQRQLEVLRALGPDGRVRIAAEMSEDALRLDLVSEWNEARKTPLD